MTTDANEFQNTEPSGTIAEGEQVTIEALEYPDDKSVRFILRGEHGGTEVHLIPFKGMTNLGRRRWMNKQYIGVTFKKVVHITWTNWEQGAPVTLQIRMGAYDALMFLGRNITNQRPFIFTNVLSIAAKMRSGTWHVTHQGIGFWTDGNMYDGQNRCMGLVLVGGDSTVPMTVSLGMPKEAVLGTDEGHTRRTIDNAVLGELVSVDTLDNLPPRHLLTSMCRCIHFEATGSDLLSGEGLSEILHTYEPSLRAVCHIYKSGFTKSKMLRKGPVLAGFLLAHRRYPKETLAAFEQIAKGAIPGDDQHNPLRRIEGFLAAIVGKGKKVYTKSAHNEFSDSSNTIYKILYGLRAHILRKSLPSLNADRQALRFFYTQDEDILKTIGPVVGGDTEFLN